MLFVFPYNYYISNISEEEEKLVRPLWSKTNTTKEGAHTGYKRTWHEPKRNEETTTVCVNVKKEARKCSAREKRLATKDSMMKWEAWQKFTYSSCVLLILIRGGRACERRKQFKRDILKHWKLEDRTRTKQVNWRRRRMSLDKKRKTRDVLRFTITKRFIYYC